MNGLGEPSLWWVAIAIQLAIIAAAIIRVGVTRRRIHSRDVALQYEPPLDVDAATAALLLGKRGRAGTAAILEQAVAGSIRIHRTAHGTFRAGYLRAFTGERRLALQTAIFGRSVTRGAVASVGPQAVRSDEQNLARRGWIWSVRNQPVVRSGAGRAVLLPLIGIALGVVFVILIVAASATTSASQETYAGWQLLVFFFIASVIASVILFILTLGLPGPSGLAARAHLTGLQTFMLSPEVERRAVLASAGMTARTDIVQLYERLLPYAVAMGIVRQWAHALALELDAVPLWLTDARGFAGSRTATVAVGSVGGGFSADGFAGCVGDMCDGGTGDSGGSGSDSGGGIGFGGSDGGFGGGDGGGGDGGGGDGGGGGGGD